MLYCSRGRTSLMDLLLTDDSCSLPPLPPPRKKLPTKKGKTPTEKKTKTNPHTEKKKLPTGGELPTGQKPPTKMRNRSLHLFHTAATPPHR